MPFFALRTANVAWSKSIWSQRRSTSSEALRPCLYASNTMVASRWPYRFALAASVSFATSASVKYSLVRNSAFGRRSGVATVRFTVVGDTSLRCDFAMFSAPLPLQLFEQ